MLDSPARAVAVISFHASPLGELGRGENGGMNLAIRRLCEELSMVGVPTDVFVRRDDSSAPDEELIGPRSRLVRVPAGPATGLPKAQVRRHAGAFTRAVVAHAASERRHYRLVHGHYWLGGVVAGDLARRWSIPWVQSFHTLARIKAAAGLVAERGRARKEAELGRSADIVLAASRAEAADLHGLYGVAEERLRVVSPGVDHVPSPDPARLAVLRRRLDLEGRRVLLFAGRLEALKGADVLLRAMARLADHRDLADVVGLIIGDNSGDGGAVPGMSSAGERGRLEKLAAEVGVDGRVRFVGALEHSELLEHHALADVCVVPSRTETFGFVALEAQAMGTPVVATAVGGLVEVVEDGVTGHLVGANDAGGFAERIATLLRDPTERARMGERARARALTFSWRGAAAHLGDIYDVVAPPPPAAGWEDSAGR